MADESRQVRMWDGEFGRRYWERHPTTVEGFDDLRIEQWGETQSAVMERFLGHIDRDADVLEVGCGIGLQLELLGRMGFDTLVGVDVHEWALSHCRRERPGCRVVRADARALPFRDGQFDLVLTNELLVTIPPSHVDAVVNELVRCSNEWLWCLEFHAPEYAEIEWRGESEMLWKTDFLERIRGNHDLELVEEEVIEYTSNDDRDRAFLLRKSVTE